MMGKQASDRKLFCVGFDLESRVRRDKPRPGTWLRTES